MPIVCQISLIDNFATDDPGGVPRFWACRSRLRYRGGTMSDEPEAAPQIPVVGPDGQVRAMRVPAGANVDEEDPIAVAWRKVEASWDDDDAHRAFIGLCASLGRLPEAGARYRQVKESDPARRDDAHARIEGLITLAMQSLQLDRSEPPRHARGGLFLLALAVSTTLIAWTLWTWWGTR